MFRPYYILYQRLHHTSNQTSLFNNNHPYLSIIHRIDEVLERSQRHANHSPRLLVPAMRFDSILLVYTLSLVRQYILHESK